MSTDAPLPPNETYDAPWKSALANYFSEFIAFYFPDVHGAIDWKREPEFLSMLPYLATIAVLVYICRDPKTILLNKPMSLGQNFKAD
eukprot:gene18429-20982_t